ncbi:GntR family transcriptional regulator [Defluviitalea phaphyphila]|uniref:GntR family transcriptional regulator n=1 Tax=Defluviitalea phaphyphila TaxID=1473580 RepID=UPI000730827C|nr:GntR family transcriptional regulator [Defluviitalea phaphyphila]
MTTKKNVKKYKYITVYQDLLNKILTDIFPVNSMLPSEKELKSMYSVERTTVRKALDLLVKDGIIEKHPGVGAKVIRKKKVVTENSNDITNDTILFFLAKTKNNNDRLTQPFYASLFYYIEKDLQNLGYKTIYSTLSPNDNIKEILKKYTYAGIIFASFGILKDHIDFVASTNIPFVVVNNDYMNGLTVMPDNFLGGYLATKHLIELGHKKIGALKGLSKDKSCQDRLLGFKVALQENNIEFNEEFQRSTNWEAESGYENMKDMILNNKELPTAIFAFNDATALGAIRAINEMGLKVPDDISIIGFDNISQSEYVFPQLSTIDTNVQTISKTAVLSLYAKIKKFDLPNIKMVVPVTLVVRGSTAEPNK